MKVLLLCLAFAAVTLAMPVAEEKPDVGAPPPSVAPVKSAEVNDQPAPAVEPKSDEAPVSSELDKQSEPKDGPAEEIKSEVNAKIPDKEIKPEDALESKSAKPELELEKKPESSDVAEKPDEKAAKPEAKLTEELKATQVPATVNEVHKDASAKSAAQLVESFDVVSAVKNDASIADEGIMPAAVIPIQQKQPESEPIKPDSSVLAEEPTKTEAIKTEEPKIDAKASEPALDAAPAASEPKSPAAEDTQRVVRNTVEIKPVLAKDKDSENKPEVAEVNKSDEETKPNENSNPELAVDSKPASDVISEPAPAVKSNAESADKTEAADKQAQPTVDAKDETKQEEPKPSDSPVVSEQKQGVDEVKKPADDQLNPKSSEEQDEKPVKDQPKHSSSEETSNENSSESHSDEHIK